MRRFAIVLVALFVSASGAGGGYAQPIGTESGTAVITDWPGSLPFLLEDMGRNAPYLLPEIDSLALDYRYTATDSTSRWGFVLGWEPGRRVLYEGRVLPRRRAPSNVRMVNVEFRAKVRANGEYVGDMIVAVDSMSLAPYPSLYSFEVTVTHERVFLKTTPAAARRALRNGATLHDLVVERMGFTAAGRSPSK